MNFNLNNGGYGFQRPDYGATLKNFFKQKSVLNWLVILNVGLWLIVAFSNLFLWLYKSQTPNVLVDFLSLPADLSVLAHRPWTIVTYMILHSRFWPMLFNVMMLWFGGLVFRNLLSEKQLAWTYVIGGLVGALLFVLAYNVFPAFEAARSSAMVMGATASVFAVLVAAFAYSPDYAIPLLVFGKMKFLWIVVIFLVIDLASISPENAGTYIAHFGGALYGLAYGFLLRKGFKLGQLEKPKMRRPKMEYTPYEEVYDEPQVPRSDEEYNYQKAEKERNVDAILDKIAKSGYASLTQKEKEFLFKNSK